MTTPKAIQKKTAPKKAAPKAKVAKAAAALSAARYTLEGKEAGKVTLPEAVFGLPWNADLVHQVVVGQLANARTPVAHVKDRSEVRGGGRKPWRQKGTGRARHGSRRSPIWKGGGVTHGPSKEKSYKKKINKKMRTKALYTSLSVKLRDNELLFVDPLKFEKPMTAQAKALLAALSGVSGFEALTKKKENVALIVTVGNDMNVKRSFLNFGNIEVEEARNINPVDVLTYKYVIIADPEEAIKIISGRMK